MAREMVEILLVEDNPDDVELTLRALNKNNLANRIHVARDGAEALEFLFGPPGQTDAALTEVPKVVLLDLKLPKVDGIEVLRRIKANEQTRRIPVVVMTASQEEKDVIRSYELGVNSYIVKPVDFAQFTEAVRSLGMYWLLLNHPPKG
jgi:two-component system response regulator